MRRLRLIPILLACVQLVNCAGLTKQQKAEITSVRIVPEANEAGAYTEPTFTSNQAADTIGFASGFAGGLIGGAIATAIVGGAEAAKSAANKDVRKVIEESSPKDLDAVLAQQLTAQLKQDSFFQSRITEAPTAPCILVVTINRYGLEKAPNGNHSPAIYATSFVKMPAKQNVLKRVYRADGIGYHPGGNRTSNAPIKTYAADPKLLRTHYEEVAVSLAAFIGKSYSKAAGAKGP